MGLRFLDGASSGLAAQIRAALASQELPIEEDGLAPGKGFQIAVAPALTSEIAAEVQRCADQGATVLLVIAPSEMSAALAFTALAAGAYDVLSWPRLADPARAIAARWRRWARIEDAVESRVVRENLIGQSRVWRSALRHLIEVALFSDGPVLLTGPSGSGKELCARLVHTLDPRADKRDLVTVDCTLVGAELAQSELFGHERGAYTGAAGARRGAIALADRGTLFLDEIGELPMRLQAELLRAVQEHSYKPVGADQWQSSNFRLVCATHRDLDQEERQGRFRLDFFHRIAGHRCQLPALDDRREDILPLARHFLRQQQRDDRADFDEVVARVLVERRYPGNVRELRQLITRIALRHVGPDPVTIGDLPAAERPALAEPPASPEGLFAAAASQALALGIGLKDIGRLAEETAVRLAVEDAGGSLQVAARRLGVSDRALQLRRAQRSDTAS